MRRRLPQLLVLLVVGLFAAGWLARREIEVDLTTEDIGASLEALRMWVDSLGWQGPAIFVAIVTFRAFLFLPSALLLLAGGSAFGNVWGALLGASGILLSACLNFGIARGLGREWLQPFLTGGMQHVEHRLENAGLGVVGLSTAHPAGIMTPFFYAAGFLTIEFAPFVMVVAAGSSVRAATYSFLGSVIVEWGWQRSLAVGLALVVVALLPLLHRGLRTRILGESRAAGSRPAAEGP